MAHSINSTPVNKMKHARSKSPTPNLTVEKKAMKKKGIPEDPEEPIIIGYQVVGTYNYQNLDIDRSPDLQCPYVKMIDNVSSLHLLKPDSVKASYFKKKEVGLFHLFLSKTFITEALWKLTNKRLESRLISAVSKMKC